LDGTYTASLVANDGKVSSDVSTMRVTAGPLNVAPVALASASPTTVSLADLDAAKLVTLDGGGSSDENGDVLTTYTWVLTSFPGTTAPTLTVDPTNRSKSTFTPTDAGSYVATLVVSDGKLSSAVRAGSTVVVTVTP
jgi:hypothetical protein